MKIFFNLKSVISNFFSQHFYNLKVITLVISVKLSDNLHEESICKWNLIFWNPNFDIEVWSLGFIAGKVITVSSAKSLPQKSKISSWLRLT